MGLVVTDLDTLGGLASIAYDINHVGQIVVVQGTARSAGGFLETGRSNG
jgi:uncharacterized membrane protein